MNSFFRKTICSITAAAMLTAGAGAFDSVDFSNGSLSGITQSEDGLLITDVFNKIVWQVNDTGTEQYAGQIGVPDINGEPIGKYSDGTKATALFLEPWAITPFLNGYAVSDSEAAAIRYIDDSAVRTLTGTGECGDNDGRGTAASFNHPTGLAADESGNLYIADTGNGKIRMLDTSGNVSTVFSGLVDPTGICFSDGTLYICETGRSRIVSLRNGELSVIAGFNEVPDEEEYTAGYSDGPIEKARFDHPQGIAVSASGDIFIADTGNHAIRRISGGRVYTLAKSDNQPVMPVSPRGIIIIDDTLYSTDTFMKNLFSVSTACPGYSDIAAGEWYSEYVTEASERGIVNGCGENEFAPSSILTRAMFTVMLGRVQESIDGCTVINGITDFSDISENSWYSGSVRWAADSGIVNGFSDVFKPGDALTRSQAAVMLFRYAEFLGMDTTARADLTVFSDYAEISGWARDALSWACAAGIFEGDEQGRLLPEASATRAHGSKLIIEFMDFFGL